MEPKDAVYPNGPVLWNPVIVAQLKEFCIQFAFFYKIPEVLSISDSVHMSQLTYGGAVIWAFTKKRDSPTNLFCFKNSKCHLCDNFETLTRITSLKEYGETQLLQSLAYYSDYGTEGFS